jgi:hypothetical protein
MKIKKSRNAFIMASLLSLLIPLYSQSAYELPEVMKIDLKRLEETWNILDQFAEKIWPGWDNYRDVPFRFRYPNGVDMLVGHPDPPDSFELLNGVELQGKKIFVDRHNEIPLELKPPMRGGGGIIPFGKSKPIPIVDLRISEFREADKDEEKKTSLPEEFRFASDRQILTNIHELFHCFQRSIYRYRFGNFRCNPDANYAIYAEIEGIALENAYLETDDEKARQYLKDFIVARELKRTALMEREQNQESEDDLMEGTAVYSETMALQLMKEGYTPFISKEDDPYFFRFQYANEMLEQKLDYLREQRKTSLDSRGKCYPYGCFQALLLSRFFPDWQENFFKEQKLLDQFLSKSLDMTEEEKEKIAQGLKTRYVLDDISKHHTQRVAQRDKTLEMFQARKGRVYVINFKPTGEYLYPKGYDESFEVGLMHLYPEGIETIEIQEVLFMGEKTPIMQDQLFYIKWIDTEATPGEKGYSVTFSRQEGENIYYDAEIKTKGFVLKAPKIEVKDREPRIKITILSKIKSEPKIN